VWNIAEFSVVQYCVPLYVTYCTYCMVLCSVVIFLLVLPFSIMSDNAL
jgi:hypothetical protein